MQSFGGQSIRAVPAHVDLQISDGRQVFKWTAKVGFVEFVQAEDEVAVLGHGGCLEYFRATFDGDRREVELVPTTRFPGTVHG